MKVLVVEDETSAYENLKAILQEISLDIEIVANTDSVASTVNWLNNNPLPNLIFMDVHLSDESAFSIFNKINIETPIIFTTAYDMYALDAFKVNSVDYLLKPIKTADVKRAIEKFNKFNTSDISTYLKNLSQLSENKKYPDKLLIYSKDKLLPIDITNICMFYTTNKDANVYLKDNTVYPYTKTLEQTMLQLNPNKFYRANKQFIINKDYIKDITIWLDNRLLVTMNIQTPERIFISKNKASEFKMWLVN